MDRPRPRFDTRLTAALLASPTWILSFVVLQASLVWGEGLRCDESCDGGGWQHTSDAWQWHILSALGAVTFVAGTALVVCAWRGRLVGALVALIAAVSAALVGGSVLEPGWLSHIDRHPGAAAVCVTAVFAALAAAFAGARGRRG